MVRVPPSRGRTPTIWRTGRKIFKPMASERWYVDGTGRGGAGKQDGDRVKRSRVGTVVLRSVFTVFGLILLGLLARAAPALAETRIALVVTNQAYTQPGAQLTAAHRDGEVVKAALEKVGFRSGHILTRT